MTDVQPIKAPVGAAAVACLPCRKLKMRCEGADKPPCVRCKKRGNTCEVVLGNRYVKRNNMKASATPSTHSVNAANATSLSTGPSAIVPTFPIMPSQTMDPIGYPPTAWHLNLSVFDVNDSTGQADDGSNEIPSTQFPSVYNASPFDTITSELAGKVANDQASKSNEYLQPGEDLLDENVTQIVYWVEFFRARIIQHVPFLRASEFDNAQEFVHRRKLLAYAIALVSTSYVPGHEAFREVLLKETWDTVHTHSSNHSSLSQDELWTLLQTVSLLVLYPCPSIYNDEGLPDYGGGALPLYPSLKTFAEHIGMRLQLHRSPDQLASVQSKNLTSDEIEGLTSRCLMWLFLYTISCHWSILAGTPPTIPLDRSIRLGSELLRPKNKDPAIWRMLCEVEMFAIWDKFPLLREWWCTPGSGDPKQYKSEVTQFDAETYNWSRRWTRQAEFTSEQLNPTHFNNSFVEFLLRHTQFHVSAYAARSASGEHSWSGKVAQRSFDGDLVNEALQKASHKNNFLSQVSPIALATARFVPPIAYAMSTHSALFILTACEAIPEAIPSLDRHLASVKQLAEFMVAIATPSNPSPKLFADRILLRLDRANQNIAISRSQTSGSDPGSLTRTPMEKLNNDDGEAKHSSKEDGFDYMNFVAEPFEDIDMFGVDYQWT